MDVKDERDMSAAFSNGDGKETGPSVIQSDDNIRCKNSDADDELDYLPEKLRGALLPFQKEGVKYGLRKEGRLLIADEMGLGKTVEALCVAYKYKDEWPLLIVTPASMRYGR